MKMKEWIVAEPLRSAVLDKRVRVHLSIEVDDWQKLGERVSYPTV